MGRSSRAGRWGAHVGVGDARMMYGYSRGGSGFAWRRPNPGSSKYARKFRLSVLFVKPRSSSKLEMITDLLRLAVYPVFFYERKCKGCYLSY